MFIINIYNQTNFFHIPEKIRKIIKTAGFLRGDREYPTHRNQYIYSGLLKFDFYVFLGDIKGDLMCPYITITGG